MNTRLLAACLLVPVSASAVRVVSIPAGRLAPASASAAAGAATASAAPLSAAAAPAALSIAAPAAALSAADLALFEARGLAPFGDEKLDSAMAELFRTQAAWTEKAKALIPGYEDPATQRDAAARERAAGELAKASPAVVDKALASGDEQLQFAAYHALSRGFNQHVVWVEIPERRALVAQLARLLKDTPSGALKREIAAKFVPWLAAQWKGSDFLGEAMDAIVAAAAGQDAGTKAEFAKSVSAIPVPEPAEGIPPAVVGGMAKRKSGWVAALLAPNMPMASRPAPDFAEYATAGNEGAKLTWLRRNAYAQAPFAHERTMAQFAGMAEAIRTFPEHGPGGYLGTSFNRDRAAVVKLAGRAHAIALARGSGSKYVTARAAKLADSLGRLDNDGKVLDAIESFLKSNAGQLTKTELEIVEELITLVPAASEHGSPFGGYLGARFNQRVASLAAAAKSARERAAIP